ncbi:MAG: tRNA (adenosine(37)-N6)-threonylcarbamoyltransferase complex transferase subunit TsaD [Blastocatellia bacterium]|nr:tRNA (adenosine(37)-N6)-threonylcarbamoyltransferase complex transferase subunit TsaD [Blastocatellia bacterium]
MRFVLGIESSCDETAAAVVEDGRIVHSNVIASQIETHKIYGGVVPEIASREHLSKITAVVAQALEQAGKSFAEIDGIAVTCGPGLVGSLLVGLAYAKSVAFALGKPLIGIHHIEGHIFSVAFEHPPVSYPALAFIISGGHTNLFWMPEAGHYVRLGHTRDDAAGEAYDKVAKLLGLAYPGGPILDRMAKAGDAAAAPLVFRPPLMPDAPYDFSFSGLKTAVLRFVREQHLETKVPAEPLPQVYFDVAASFQQAVVQTLVKTLGRALRDYPVQTVVIGGGVACNSALRKGLEELAAHSQTPIYVPSPVYTTDNAAMIAAAGHFRFSRGERSDWTLGVNPALKLHHSDIRPPTQRKIRYRS